MQNDKFHTPTDDKTEQIASELLSLTPLLNRIVSYELQNIDHDETTIVQLRVLSHLMEEPITMSELARRRRISLQASSEHVQGLVTRGWVERVPDANDRRRYLLHITDAGRTQFEAARDQLVRALMPSIDKLTPEIFNQIQEVLPALRQVLVEHPID